MTRLKKLQKKIGIYLFWFILITSFCFFAVLIILKANGWQLNHRNWNLVQTGMIVLNSQSQSTTVKVNGKIYESNYPIKISNLSPGYYDVQVTAEKYQGWQKTVEVKQGFASINDNIVLFLESPSETDVPSNITLENLQKGTPKPELEVRQKEIFYQGNFVTRFSEDIVMATLYTDNHHIIFQFADELRVIDLDGSNNKLLAKLTSIEPTSVSFDDNGKIIYFIDQNKVLGKIIR